MMKEKLRSKIHQAKVTQTEKEYVGSITIGENMLKASGIDENDRVQVVNIENGERIETYVIKGEKGEICLNGAAARKFCQNDRVIIIAYSIYQEDEKTDPTIVHVDKENKVVDVE